MLIDFYQEFNKRQRQLSRPWAYLFISNLERQLAEDLSWRSIDIGVEKSRIFMNNGSEIDLVDSGEIVGVGEFRKTPGGEFLENPIDQQGKILENPGGEFLENPGGSEIDQSVEQDPDKNNFPENPGPGEFQETPWQCFFTPLAMFRFNGDI
jgi:hypothetical protein